MKPTWNAVSAEGVKLISTTLDTVGWYGRSVADLDLLADAFALQDDEPSSFNGVAGARILIDATAYKADATSLATLAQAAQRLEAAEANIVHRDLAGIHPARRNVGDRVALGRPDRVSRSVAATPASAA